jgi:hypothetical protein
MYNNQGLICFPFNAVEDTVLVCLLNNEKRIVLTIKTKLGKVLEVPPILKDTKSNEIALQKALDAKNNFKNFSFHVAGERSLIKLENFYKYAS